MLRLIWLSLLVSACGMRSTESPQLSEEQRGVAIERGRALERGAPVLETQPRGSSYRLLRLTGDREPRVHPDADVSALVLSGTVRLWLDAAGELRPRELEAGESVEIPKGTLYLLESRSEYGASVFLLFDEATDGDSPQRSEPAPVSALGAENGD